MVASKDNFPLLAELLAEQQRLATPVAKFSEAHEHAAAPALEPVYRDLIPLTAPKPGEQYAFEVELDSCTGCKACVSACHSLNGLDDNETWRDVGLVVGGDDRRPFQQTVTTACHHCAEPGCLSGCPVLAYEKDPITGIVRHLDDQCIGCQYCVLKCPYDVPKYNARLGIVRKCDMCHGRLAEGEAPACVQACPTQAIRIVTVKAEAPVARARGHGGFLPGAPDPDYTRPTTRYVSRKGLAADLRAADAAALRVQPAHWPLVGTLTLVPFAVGCFGAAAAVGGREESVIHYMTLWGAAAAVLGVGISVAHLGQPLRAWRVFLGWRKSWLSREAMVLGAWLPVVGAAVWAPALSGVAAAVGAVGLICSAMLYADTRRAFWAAGFGAAKILGTAVVLGAAMMLAMGVAVEIATAVLAAGVVGKLACDARVIRVLDEVDEDAPAVGRAASARLLKGPLWRVFASRIVLGLSGGVLLPMQVLTGVAPAWVAWAAFVAVAVGELTERYLFFRAVDAPKMPGVAA
jgi:Fe-S-cluster-containing hydrogenase components 1